MFVYIVLICLRSWFAQCLQHLSDLAQFTGRCGGVGWSRGPGCSFSIALLLSAVGASLVWVVLGFFLTGV